MFLKTDWKISLEWERLYERKPRVSITLCNCGKIARARSLSPSIHKFDDEFIYSGLSAAFGHELRPNGVSI